MAEIELRDTEEWTPITRNGRKQESRPYRKCPHCELHRFRLVRITGGFILSENRWKMCKNCKYKEDPNGVTA